MQIAFYVDYVVNTSARIVLRVRTYTYLFQIEITFQFNVWEIKMKTN